jgi:hypothetical protein
VVRAPAEDDRSLNERSSQHTSISLAQIRKVLASITVPVRSYLAKVPVPFFSPAWRQKPPKGNDPPPRPEK